MDFHCRIGRRGCKLRFESSDNRKGLKAKKSRCLLRVSTRRYSGSSYARMPLLLSVCASLSPIHTTKE